MADQTQKEDINKQIMVFDSKYWIFLMVLSLCCFCPVFMIYYMGGLNKHDFDQFINHPEDMHRFLVLNNLFYSILGFDGPILAMVILALIFTIDERNCRAPPNLNQNGSDAGAKRNVKKKWSRKGRLMFLIYVVFVFLLVAIGPSLTMYYATDIGGTLNKIRRREFNSQQDIQLFGVSFQVRNNIFYLLVGLGVYTMVLMVGALVHPWWREEIDDETSESVPEKTNLPQGKPVDSVVFIDINPWFIC